jgi:multidrug transporter EmrE-like cation transporter
VYIPYCTGDLFWGANDATYGPYTIQHRGFVNFQAVLKYLEDNTNFPGKIFVTGSSAGSYGATLSYPYIKKSFKWSNVYLLGDAGAGVLGGTFPTTGIYNWNVQMPDWIFPNGYDPTMTMPVVYTAIAAEYPWDQVGQYTTAFDGTQIFFLNVMININNPAAWNTITPAIIGLWHFTMLDYAYTTAEASPNYRYYIGAGTVHTIMMSPKFFTESSGGISFVDWINRMIYNPNKWYNQECVNCLQ